MIYKHNTCSNRGMQFGLLGMCHNLENGSLKRPNAYSGRRGIVGENRSLSPPILCKLNSNMSKQTISCLLKGQYGKLEATGHLQTKGMWSLIQTEEKIMLS